MYIDRILYPIGTLGPGARLVIWTAGCSKQCKGCANPELWNCHNGQNISVGILFENIIKCFNTQNIDGITITGGDPCEQMDELIELTTLFRGITEDILVYTGYTYDELRSSTDKSKWEKFRANISVLIDGRYEEDKNSPDCVLRGSSNQQIIFLNVDDKLRCKYSEYLNQGRKIQNVVYKNKIISVGIHNKI